MRRPSPALLVPVALVALLAPSACSTEDEKARDTTAPTSADPGEGTGAPEDTATPGDTGTAGDTGTGDGPRFEPADYTYRLGVICYCPRPGPIDVTVADGVVTSAVVARGPQKGQPAPDYTRLSINDILDAADDAEAANGSADVTWPDGSTHPTSIVIDRIIGAVDDEVTYTIRAVRVD